MHRPLRLFALALAVSCGGTSTTTTPPTAAPSSFREVEAEASDAPTDEGLLELALAGTEDDDGPDLGARFEVRPLRIPKPPRGGTARFGLPGGERAWVTALPSEQVLASPAYGDGKVFLGGGFSSHQFFALDAFGGELKWTIAAPDGGPTAAIYERDKVIFNTESCTIFVADGDTGELLWKRWLGDPLMSQPALAGDLVLSAYPKDGAHRFGAFALADGEPVWDTEISADIIQAPQVVGDSAYFATMDGVVRRVRHRDGRVLWTREIGASSALWVDDGKVLLTRAVGTGDARMEEPVVLDARTGRVEDRGDRVPAPYLAGNSRDRALGAGQAGAWGNVPHGEHLGLRNVAAGWAFQGSTPAVADGRAYYAVGNELRARDIATGEIVWRRRDPAAGDAQTLSPPAVVGAQLVYGTVDGHLYFTDIDTGMTVRAYDLGEPVVFQPIVAQGWVYVATGAGRLIGLELGDAAMDGWHMWGGNAQHAGPVVVDGRPSEALLASLDRPDRGTLQVAGPMDTTTQESEEATAEAHAYDGTPLPETSMTVDAKVTGFVARVALTQTFDNPHEEAIEAQYLFPLPPNAAVDAMEMHIGSRVVRARIRRRAQARREYEAARETGRRAALLEQERPDLFVQRVANIGPHQRIEVRIEYVQTLPFDAVDGGHYELTFPMGAPPRSNPGATEVQRLDPSVQRVAGSVELRVALEPGLPLGEVVSPSHDITLERRDQGALVRLGEDADADHDFVLRYAVGGETPDATVFAEREPASPVATSGAEGHFSLLLQPPSAAATTDAVPRAVTFVLDRSSSMRGPAMDQARAVMREVIAGLGDADALQILTFSDRIEALAEGPTPFTAELRTRADAMLEELHTVGSTRMVPALERALDEADSGDRLPIVVLLTDGYIGNEASVLRSMVGHLGHARVFALGVGSSPNRFLIERAAEVGRGQAVFATPTEDAAKVGERFASLIARPVFTDVTVDWGDLDVRDVYPRRIPDLFAGRPVVLHGRFAQGGTARVRVRGTMNGRRYERSFDVALPERGTEATSARMQSSLWARAAVEDRMQKLTLRDDPELVEEITELGLRHAIVTQWTSFVAVEEERVEEEATTGPTISPARSLPGDPEIRVPAPADALAVTLVLPFGETIAADWEPELGVWSGRFLVPADAEEGSFPVDILVVHADGEAEQLRVWYTVDASAPVFETEIVQTPDGRVLRATQLVTDADLRQVGRRRSDLSEARAQLLHDARRVELRVEGEVLALELAGPGTWEVALPNAADGPGTLVVVDLAANVRTQSVELR